MTGNRSEMMSGRDGTEIRPITPTGGSSGESCTMDESLMQQFRVKDEALRCVNFFFWQKTNDGMSRIRDG